MTDSRIGAWALCALVACAALGGFSAQRFEKVPEQAQSALKGSRGKPFLSGFAFIGGSYLKPPYRVARYGTAIYVNDVQATGQIVPWRNFLATQDGYVPPAKPTAAPKGEKKASDDLFDDAPEPVSKDDAKDSAAKIVFAANAKSDRLLKQINDQRVAIQRRLKAGNICFFGPRYAPVVVQPRIAKSLLEVLPEAIRDAADGAALASALRAKGFAFMNLALCEDLIECRADYPALIERRKQLQEEEKIFQGGRR